MDHLDNQVCGVSKEPLVTCKIQETCLNAHISHASPTNLITDGGLNCDFRFSKLDVWQHYHIVFLTVCVCSGRRADLPSGNIVAA